MTSPSDRTTHRALDRMLPFWIWFAAVIVPIAVALLLVPSRGHLGPADDALVLVVVTVAIASWGNRGAAALAAIVAAASFDFLLTRPYGSFRISQQGDITTEVLFVAVGLLVGELAARGRQHQRAAVRGHLEISRLHDLAQRIAGGEEPEFVLIAVANELRELLKLQDCRFVWEQPSGKGRVDRQRRHGATQSASLADGNGGPANETGGAPGPRWRQDSRDLSLDTHSRGAHQPGAVPRGRCSGRPTRRCARSRGELKLGSLPNGHLVRVLVSADDVVWRPSLHWAGFPWMKVRSLWLHTSLEDVATP